MLSPCNDLSLATSQLQICITWMSDAPGNWNAPRCFRQAQQMRLSGVGLPCSSQLAGAAKVSPEGLLS